MLLPGRELDALVAEKVMGYGPEFMETFFKKQPWVCQYSTSIAAAFEVVARIMPSYNRKISIETYEGEVWSIKPCGTSSESLPHAICLAALKAVGYLK